jgi:hypothetical protein
MAGVRMVLVVLSVVMLVTLTACNSDDAASGAGIPSAFRNLGKRSDSSLGEQRGSATTR